MTSLSTRARRRMKSKTPVLDNVRKHWEHIKKAMDDGVSRAALYAELTAEGVFVGKNPSGFNQAINKMLAQAALPGAAAPVSIPVSPHTAPVPPVPVDAAKWSTRGFDDDRVVASWGADR